MSRVLCVRCAGYKGEVLDDGCDMHRAAPAMYEALKCCLADLEGVMPEFEPGGDREHPGWKSMAEARAALKLAEGGGNA